MHSHLELHDFTPAEVATITGLSAESQRDWRRRGILTSRRDGRSAFTSLEVAEVIVRRALNDLGVPLTVSSKAARLGGAMALYAAVLTEGALSEGSLEITDPISLAMNYLFVPPTDFVSALSDMSPAVSKALQPLTEMLPVMPAKDWAGVEELVDLCRDTTDGVSWGVVDLIAVGKKLARAAARPLASHSLGDAPTGPYFVCYHCSHGDHHAR